MASSAAPHQSESAIPLEKTNTLEQSVSAAAEPPLSHQGWAQPAQVNAGATSEGSFVRYRACVDACVTAHGDGAIWCVADCDVALRTSLAKEMGSVTVDPALSLGNAALLMPYINQRQQVLQQDRAKLLADGIITDLQLDTVKSASLRAYVNRPDVIALIATQTSLIPANGTVITPARRRFWQRSRSAVEEAAESVPDLNVLGTFLKQFYPSAREAWVRSYPVVLSLITVLVGVYRTWGYGNDIPSRPPDSGIGDIVVGGGTDAFTLLLVGVAIFASAVLLFSRSIREFMMTQRVGIALLILCYLMIAAALVRAAFWGFEEPFRWVTPGLS